MGRLSSNLHKYGWVGDAFVCLLIAALWSLPTFLNGFPLSYFDSAYYTHNAFNLLQPAHIAWRPITYSVFMRAGFAAFGMSGLILLQNWIVAFFLLKFSRFVFADIKRWMFVVIALGLSVSPLVHISNYVMPDIFSPLAILATLAFFYCKPEEKKFYFVVGVIFALMHFANLICVVPLVIYHYAKSHRKQLVGGLALFVLAMGFRLLFFFPQKSFEESAHYFIHSRLVAFEITNIYFDKVCPREDLVFCQANSGRFEIWEGARKPSGFGPQISILPSVVKSNQEILKSTLAWSYFFKAVNHTVEQMFRFAKPMEVVVEDTQLVRQYAIYLDRETALTFFNPRIFNGRDFSLHDYRQALEKVFLVVTLLSLLYLAWLVYRKELTNLQENILYYFISAYTLNSIAIGFLSEPLGRYNNKLVWVFTFLALLFFTEGRLVATRWGRTPESSTPNADDPDAPATQSPSAMAVRLPLHKNG